MKIAKTGLVLKLLQHEKKKDYREQFISIRLSDYTEGFQKEGRALKRRRAGGWRKRSKRSGGKGEQQRRAENERKERRRSEGELEEMEEKE